MKSLFLLSGLFFGDLFLSPAESYAQWQPDVRLTNDPHNSYTSDNQVWRIAASGNFVHIVWFDERDGNREIYYKRSTNEGVSWGADIRLTRNLAVSTRPSVSVSDSTVHVVWNDTRDDHYEIYYKRSQSGGFRWEADTRLTNNSTASSTPSVSVSGRVVHVVWQCYRDGNFEIYHKRSTDGGDSWEADTRLTNDTASSGLPSVSALGLNVHVVWQDLRDGNLEVYYKRSRTAGFTWEADTRLTNDSASSQCASVASSGLVVHVVWHDFRDGNTQIYYKRSTDNGINWGTDTRLTNNSASSAIPSMSVSGQVVHVVWQDTRDAENDEIYYKRSTDGGVSWEADTRLTNNSAGSQYASVASSGLVVHVVWHDYRDGNYEIYYKRNPTGNITGIKNIDLEIPKEFSLSQNYPNPFNPGTRIIFAVPIGAGVSLKVFNALGQEITVLVEEHLKPGRYEYTWLATGLPSGVYFYRLQAGSFIQANKLLLLR